MDVREIEAGADVKSILECGFAVLRAISASLELAQREGGGECARGGYAADERGKSQARKSESAGVQASGKDDEINEDERAEEKKVEG